MKKAYSYLRVSTEKQPRHDPVELQVNVLPYQWAKEKNITIVRENSKPTTFSFTIQYEQQDKKSGGGDL